MTGLTALELRQQVRDQQQAPHKATLEQLRSERARIAAESAAVSARLAGAAVDAYAAGMSEQAIAAACGASRMTVRKWLGK